MYLREKFKRTRASLVLLSNYKIHDIRRENVDETDIFCFR